MFLHATRLGQTMVKSRERLSAKRQIIMTDAASARVRTAVKTGSNMCAIRLMLVMLECASSALFDEGLNHLGRFSPNIARCGIACTPYQNIERLETMLSPILLTVAVIRWGFIQCSHIKHKILAVWSVKISRLAKHTAHSPWFSQHHGSIILMSTTRAMLGHCQIPKPRSSPFQA
jgi:hypothetical protein